MNSDPMITPFRRRPIFWLAMGSLILFVALALAVKLGITQSYDERLLLALHGSTLGNMQSTFSIITALGGAVFVSLVAVMWAAILLRKRRLPQAFFVLASVGGAAVAGTLLKIIFNRPRPELWERIVTETSMSFPSSHAVVSSALVITAVILARRPTLRRHVIVLGVFYILTIGLSRLILGVHYPTDILAGWLVGVVCVSISWLAVSHTWPLYRRRLRQKP